MLVLGTLNMMDWDGKFQIFVKIWRKKKKNSEKIWKSGILHLIKSQKSKITMCFCHRCYHCCWSCSNLCCHCHHHHHHHHYDNHYCLHNVFYNFRNKVVHRKSPINTISEFRGWYTKKQTHTHTQCTLHHKL